MTVSDLLSKLKKLPKDAEVRVRYTNEGEWGDYDDIAPAKKAMVYGTKRAGNKYLLIDCTLA